MATFGSVEGVWGDRLFSLRNVVRQHVIGEQLRAHLPGVSTVLDVGCGQGTQAVQLALQGHRVTGVDPSADLLAQMARTARSHGVEVEAVLGAIETLEATLAGRRFDLVCAHGLLMYLADGRAALEQLAVKARRGGLLSFTVRNGDALAYRPGLRGEWQTALSGFDTTDYVNELGAHATAHRLTDVQAWCRSLDLEIEAWYGVRVLTDGVSNVEQPDPNTLDECLRAEVEAGKRDPYRHLGSQLHFIARRA